MPVLLARPVRSLASAPSPQSSIRATSSRFQSAPTRRTSESRLTPVGESRAGVSFGGAHGSEHAQQKRRVSRILENAFGRFSLAHRNFADPGKAQQVLQHQRGL